MNSAAFHFGSGLSIAPATKQAVAEACDIANKAGGGDPVDLAFAFFSIHHAENMDALAAEARDLLRAACFVGCSGEAIIGDGREVENGPAFAVWTARLPNTVVEPFQLDYQPNAEGGSFLGWPDEFMETWPGRSTLLILADPFSFPADEMLTQLNRDQPGVPILGGMASGGRRPDQNRLLLNASVHRRGAVGVRLHGGVTVRGVVSQGCRPIGRPFLVTKADGNIIEQLGGKSALAQLQELFESLSPREQQQLRQGLHVGRVIDEYREKFGRGDFLIRNVLGVEADSGSVVIGDDVRPGQTIQFHVRDAETADVDLTKMLQAHSRGPAGALLFTCNGRGTSLFPAPDHDASALQKEWGPIAVAGFFAQGEIGPVGNKNFLHGFTASIASFEADAPASL